MGNRIKQLRREKRMTQVRLAIELEVTQETISAYEKNKHYPSVNSLLKMSELFNSSIDYILGLTNTRCMLSASDLTEDEIKLMKCYQALPAAKKEKALSYLEGLSE